MKYFWLSFYYYCFNLLVITNVVDQMRWWEELVVVAEVFTALGKGSVSWDWFSENYQQVSASAVWELLVTAIILGLPAHNGSCLSVETKVK